MLEIDKAFQEITEEVENSKTIPSEIVNKAELWNINA
jgi:hypothetical protein